MTVHQPHTAGPQGRHPAVWVTDALPPVLQAALARRGGIPRSVRETVLDQLYHRSAGELRERIERRWSARFSHLDAGRIAENADEIALDLVAAPSCPEPRCEDGWLLDEHDSAGGCPRCRRRRIESNALPADAPPAAPARQRAAAQQIRQQLRLTRSAVRHVRRPALQGDPDA
ncbi:hypothetical protein [Kitasatospora sp. NPDC088783]|uniref:hypothetical protein n=1 Tax=Kitasatospora sp. NPDC088783 TaxID=3364077 RepID=UPI0038119C75